MTARGGGRAERGRRPAASDLLAGLAIVALVVWGWHALWFLTDDAFRKIALGENYFRLLNLDYSAPQICPRSQP